MGLKGCEILLDNPWNTYYAGQTINGQVRLSFDSPKKVRGIIIRFKGEANVEWSETRHVTNSEGKDEERIDNFTAHEEYFQIQYYLLGGKNSPDTELPSGTHNYPFSCALPPTLPSSFEGEHGHVRYTVKVTLDRPWKFDQDMKMAFTVIAPVDLNLNPRTKEPCTLTLEKSFCCFCCKSGPLSVVTNVPVTGYVSGQIIPITCECDNASNVAINKVRFILKKKVTFMATNPTAEKKISKTTISELSIGPVAGGETRTFSQQLEIPSLPPTSLVNCGIIDLDYDLLIECSVSGPHTNLSGSIPITLGTVPLTSFTPPAPYRDIPAGLEDASAAPTQPVSPSTPVKAEGGAVGWNVADNFNIYPHIAPPQFVESQFRAPGITGREDTEHTKVIGDVRFAPRYPTFNFQPSAPSLNS